MFNFFLNLFGYFFLIFFRKYFFSCLLIFVGNLFVFLVIGFIRILYIFRWLVLWIFVRSWLFIMVVLFIFEFNIFKVFLKFILSGFLVKEIYLNWCFIVKFMCLLWELEIISILNFFFKCVRNFIDLFVSLVWL